jgi:hypothetical protein
MFALIRVYKAYLKIKFNNAFFLHHKKDYTKPHSREDEKIKPNKINGAAENRAE